jgi:hypothetical protein
LFISNTLYGRFVNELGFIVVFVDDIIDDVLVDDVVIVVVVVDVDVIPLLFVVDVVDVVVVDIVIFCCPCVLVTGNVGTGITLNPNSLNIKLFKSGCIIA